MPQIKIDADLRSIAKGIVLSDDIVFFQVVLFKSRTKKMFLIFANMLILIMYA
jgi:hypothetical protein